MDRGEFNTDFHSMVDFIATSPLRIETTDERTHILATVDGIQRTISESSLRHNLKLRDEDGIVSILDTEMFENLTLMGYNISQNQKFTFQKGQFSHQWKYLIHTIMQCLSPKSTGFNEFSSNIATALVCLVTNKTYNFSKMIFDDMVKNVNNKISKSLMYPRFLTIRLRMSQFCQITHIHQYVVLFHTKKLFTTLQVNNPSFSGRIVSHFDTMLVHQGEGSGTPTEPHHTPSPKADTSHPTTSLIPLPSLPTAPIPLIRTGQPLLSPPPCLMIQHQGLLPMLLMRAAQEVEILRLKERVQVLEDRESVAAKQSEDDAPIKGMSINEGEATAERISDNSEELARVLTSMDAATVLAGGIDVPTSSGSIPTASPPTTDISTGSEVAPTASPIVTSYSRRKGKEVMVETNTPKKQRLQEQIDAQVAKEIEEQQEKEHMRMNEQITRDVEVARIHAEEELQGMIDSLDRSNETIAKYLQEYQDFASELPLEKRIELISDLVKYQENYSKEHVKKQKTSEEALEIEKSTKEIPEEKMKEMMQLVPIEDVYVQALQVKHPIIDWKVHTEGKRSYWKIIRNKMHKAFPLLVRKIPLPEGDSHCLKKNATARRKVLPLLEVCTAIIVKEKPPVKDDSFL
nr:hypothetical protein [Tanacetum cinerariifolium]